MKHSYGYGLTLWTWPAVSQKHACKMRVSYYINVGGETSVANMPLRITESCCPQCGTMTKVTVRTQNGPVTKSLFLEPARGTRENITTHPQIMQYLQELKRTLREHKMSPNLTMSQIEKMKIYHSTAAQDDFLRAAPPNETVVQMIQKESLYDDPVEEEEKSSRNDKLFGSDA